MLRLRELVFATWLFMTQILSSGVRASSPKAQTILAKPPWCGAEDVFTSWTGYDLSVNSTPTTWNNPRGMSYRVLLHSILNFLLLSHATINCSWQVCAQIVANYGKSSNKEQRGWSLLTVTLCQCNFPTNLESRKSKWSVLAGAQTTIRFGLMQSGVVILYAFQATWIIPGYWYMILRGGAFTGHQRMWAMHISVTTPIFHLNPALMHLHRIILLVYTVLMGSVVNFVDDRLYIVGNQFLQRESSVQKPA